jgi:hypothetical protein
VHIRHENAEKAYKEFVGGVDKGAFFISRDFNKEQSLRMLSVDIGKGVYKSYSKSYPDGVLIKIDNNLLCDSLVSKSEIGSFRQVCYNGPSEGASSLLIVKNNSVVLMKYEASQYGPMYLNNEEKSKVANALKLIKVIEAFR